MSHFLTSSKECCEQETCRDDPQPVTVQVLGEWKFINGPFFHMKLMLIRGSMKVKQLLREIYWACKYFLVSEVPRILHCHLSPRQMCVAASCCGCVSSQSVQKGDGPEAHSCEKNYVSSISGNCRIIFSALSPPHSTVQHIFLFLLRLPPSPREPCRLCIRARAITPLQWCGPTLKWSFSLSTFSGDEPQPF